RHAGSRYRWFLHRPHRLASDAIEHVDERLLGYLRHRLDRLSADRDVDQGWRRRGVVIPQAVMHELVVPDLLAGGRFDTDEAVAIKPGAGAMAAIVIVGRRAHGQIDIAENLVRTHRRPDIGVADLPPRFPLPGLDAG